MTSATSTSGACGPDLELEPQAEQSTRVAKPTSRARQAREIPRSVKSELLIALHVWTEPQCGGGADAAKLRSALQGRSTECRIPARTCSTVLTHQGEGYEPPGCADAGMVLRVSEMRAALCHRAPKKLRSRAAWIGSHAASEGHSASMSRCGARTWRVTLHWRDGLYFSTS